MVAKLETPEEIREEEALLLNADTIKGRASRSVQVIPLMETSVVVEIFFKIVRESKTLKRVVTVVFGVPDFYMDLRIEMTRAGEEVIFPRAQMAIAFRAAVWHDLWTSLT